MKRPLVTIEPFNPALARCVLSDLDENDRLEAQLMRGDMAGGYDLLTDWMMIQRQGAACFIGYCDDPEPSPIAVLAIVPDTVPGLGHVAMLARDHRRWKRQLVSLVRQIRRRLPVQAQHMGLHRLEARSWVGHPTAPTLLRAIGFTPDATMTGFGFSGEIRLRQWSWLADYIPPITSSKET